MTQPIYDADRWLSPIEKVLLDQAVAADRAYADPDACPDTCQRCGGQGCEQCTGPRDQYVPEYVRSSIRRWRPTT